MDTEKGIEGEWERERKWVGERREEREGDRYICDRDVIERLKLTPLK